MRVLAISSLFPSVVRPTKGIFVSKQLAGIAELCDRVRVVSPVPWTPRVLAHRPSWRAYADTPISDVIEGLTVSYPRYVQLPGRWYYPYSGKAVLLGVWAEIARIVEAEGSFDVVHGNFGLPDGEVAIQVGRRLGIPSIVTLRGSDVHTAPRWSKAAFDATSRVLKSATKIVAVSEGLRQLALKIAHPPCGVEVVYTGTDLHQFCPGDATAIRQRLGLPLVGPLCLYVGSLVPAKGVFELIRAFEEVSRRLSDVHMVFVGEGPSCSDLRSLASSLSLGDRISFVGATPHGEIASWMIAADLVILPSHAEGLPNVLVEAAACGRPVVATPVGGISEIVQDGTTGLLVPVGNEAALATAICRILESSDIGKGMGASARTFVSSRFSWELNAQRYLQVYHSAIMEHRRRAAVTSS